MPNPHFAARFKPDQARGVEQYAEDRDLDTSEVIRRAVTRFLNEEGYPRGDAMADGGHKPLVRPFMLQLAAGSLLAAFAVAFFGLLGHVGNLLVAILGGMYLVLAALLLLAYDTQLPDRLDWYLARAGYRARRRLGVSG